MENLTEKEFNTVKEIISDGLKKAAESLSFFMKETIALRETNFNISDEKYINLNENYGSNSLYVLSTEVKGELKGICYLVFTQEETDEICKVALPSEIVNNEEKLAKMQEPLLLEIDNIISASVITQIANQLKQKMYGDVPMLTRMNAATFEKTLQQQMEPDKLIIGFQTEFISSKSHFHPEFFWIWEPDLINCIRNKLLAAAN